MVRLLVGLLVLASVFTFALYVNAQEPPAERGGGSGDIRPRVRSLRRPR